MVNQQLTARESEFEFALMKLSSDKDYFHMVQSSILNDITTHYTNENDLVEQEYEQKMKGKDPSSNEYLQLSLEKNSKLQELNNSQTNEIQAHQDRVDRKEVYYDSRQEMIEAQLKDIRAQKETWSDYKQKAVEEECSYFK